MILLYVLIGIGLGCVINYAADYLPRFASTSAASPLAPPTLRLRFVDVLSVIRSRRQTDGLSRSGLGAMVELLMTTLCVYLGATQGWSPRFFFLLIASAFFILIAVIDLKYRLVPDVLTVPATIVLLFLNWVYLQTGFLNALIGGLFGLMMFALVGLLQPGKLGGGDVKLAGVIGLLFGFPYALWSLMIGIFAGGIAAIVLLLARRANRQTQMAYAPFLCAGALLALFYNPLVVMLRPIF